MHAIINQLLHFVYYSSRFLSFNAMSDFVSSQLLKVRKTFNNHCLKYHKVTIFIRLLVITQCVIATTLRTQEEQILTRLGCYKEETMDCYDLYQIISMKSSTMVN